MNANFNKVTPVERFVAVGTNAAALLANGAVVFFFPLDYLAWTEDNARLPESLDRQVSALPDVRGNEIRIVGGVHGNQKRFFYLERKSLTDFINLLGLTKLLCPPHCSVCGMLSMLDYSETQLQKWDENCNRPLQ